MKKFLALVLSIVCILSFAACSRPAGTPNTPVSNEIGPAHANEYLTEFFSSYTQMSEYISREDLALSSYTLLGADLKSLLKASYQAQSVTYTFDVPVEISDNTFSCDVVIEAPDMNMLYEAYLIDTAIDPEADLVNSFYANINAGATTSVKSDTVTLTLTYTDGTWNIASNNALVYGIFPNLDMINA